MRRLLRWSLAAVAVALAATVAVLFLTPLPPAPRGPEPGRSLFQTHCAACHGADGRGRSWRARLLFLRPGNLASPQVAVLSDQFLDALIRHGGATFGKPGMPSFGFLLGDDDIRALIQYLRILPPAPPPPQAAAPG